MVELITALLLAALALSLVTSPQFPAMAAVEATPLAVVDLSLSAT
jgi:hypothetical protein